MKTFNVVRFCLVWLLTAPFVLLYLLLISVISGKRKLIVPKMQLIYMSLNQKFVEEKGRPAMSKALQRQRIKNMIHA